MVFVLAATHRSPGHKNHEYFDTNVGGAENIVSWCKQAGIPRIIFTSSISVYGPGLDLKSEESIPNPSSAYGKSKLQSEKIFSAWQEDDSESRSLVICRPSVIFGPGEKGNFTRLANALKKGYFVIPSRNETIKACGYVKDLVRSLVFTSNLSQSRTLIYNFAFPEEYSVREICLSFKKVAGFRQPITIPVEVLLPALRLLPFGLNFIAIRATKLIESTRISSAKIEKLGFVWNYDLESSLKDWLENSRLPGGFA
jgi:nucleoside-diphosphate-sugar epimerase